ncbi:MAG: hypothetical protein R3F07_11320 [Opitutaceae bacterium]
MAPVPLQCLFSGSFYPDCLRTISGSKIFAWLALFLGFAATTAPLRAFQYEAIKDPFRERFTLHLNGLSSHFGGSSNDLNEVNWGLGAGYDLGRLGSESRILNGAVVSLSVDFYSDSFSEPGYAFGVALQNKLAGPIDLGFQVGLIHEDNLMDKGSWYLTPFLVPYLETTFDFPVNLRMSLIPPIGDLTKGVLTLQALIRF